MSHGTAFLAAAAGLLVVSAFATAEDPARPAPEAAEAAAEETRPPEVRILSGTRTTFDNAVFASFACELRNPGPEPLMFVGYRADSFDPQLAEGQVSPIYSIEVRRGDAWEEYPIGWCGTGMDGIALPPEGGGGTFGFAVPVEPPWDAVRVGVRWSRPLDFETAEASAYQTAWSEPFAAVDVAAEPAPAPQPPQP